MPVDDVTDLCVLVSSPHLAMTHQETKMHAGSGGGLWRHGCGGVFSEL